jgi:Putative endonuclease segE, GIY-YIG domain
MAKQNQISDYGHWIAPFDFTIDGWKGFVYRITNNKNGMQYIGQKGFWSKVKRPPLKGMKRVRRSLKESKWKTYTGSSNALNADIEEQTIADFKFEILSLHKSKWDMNYNEAKLILSEDAIPNQNYYNNFLGKLGRCPNNEKYSICPSKPV